LKPFAGFVNGPHALANPGGKIYRVLRERDMLTPEIIGRIFGIRRQPPPWSLPGVGAGGRSPSLAPSSRAIDAVEQLLRSGLGGASKR
jgi:hypothetical protein